MCFVGENKDIKGRHRVEKGRDCVCNQMKREKKETGTMKKRDIVRSQIRGKKVNVIKYKATNIMKICCVAGLIVSMLTGCANVRSILEEAGVQINEPHQYGIHESDTEETASAEIIAETSEENTEEAETSEESVSEEENFTTETETESGRIDHEVGGEPISDCIVGEVNPDSYNNTEDNGKIILKYYYDDGENYDKIYIMKLFDIESEIYTYNSEEKITHYYKLENIDLDKIRTLVKQYADQVADYYDDNHINQKNPSGNCLWYMDIEDYYYEGNYYNWAKKSLPENWEDFFLEVKDLVEQGKSTDEPYDEDAAVSELDSFEDCKYVYLTKYDLKTKVTKCYALDIREYQYSAILEYSTDTDTVNTYFMGNFDAEKLKELQQNIYEEAKNIDDNFHEARKRSKRGLDGVLWELEIYDENDDLAYYQYSDYTSLNGWDTFVDGIVTEYCTDFTYSHEDPRGVW